MEHIGESSWYMRTRRRHYDSSTHTDIEDEAGELEFDQLEEPIERESFGEPIGWGVSTFDHMMDDHGGAQGPRGINI